MTQTHHTQDQIQRLATLLAHTPVAMLTNADAQGALHSRPMWRLEIDADGALWFFTSLKISTLGLLEQVNLSFSDHSRATYISLTGRCELHTDSATRNRLWTPKAKPWFPEGPDSPDLALLKFIPASAEYWNSPHCTLVRLLAAASAAVGCTPKGIARHKVLAISDPVAL